MSTQEIALSPAAEISLPFTARLHNLVLTVDHKKLGLMYIVTSLIFFAISGLMAFTIRMQLLVPQNAVLPPDVFNRFFTMHGTTMVFFVGMPIIAGLMNYLVPLMIGARDMAFPRLNAFGYWVFLLAGLFLSASFLVGQAPDGGWFAYVPLTGPAYSPGLNMDFWALGIVFVGVSTTVGAVNFIVTAFKMRAPGMGLNRVPLFVWNMTVTAFMMLFAVPSLTVACLLLELDRKVGTHFYDPAGGGS